MSDQSKVNKSSYPEYLQLEKLLSCQSLESVKHGRPAHDEMLFIIIHQLYELWFKQILHDVDSMMAAFSNPTVDDSRLGVCVSRLDRIIKIQKILLEQIDVLETMTPMDFLDFRDLLFPASGFQSVQFRLLENKMGLKRDSRLKYEGADYTARLSKNEIPTAVNAEKSPSLFELVEAWLERTPFVQQPQFNFWNEYHKAVDTMLKKDEAAVQNNPYLNEESRRAQLASSARTRESFELLREEKRFSELKDKHHWRLSFKATQAALFILLYREQPALQLPFRIITQLTDIDENFTTWRYRHAQMAMRMIGTKVGTGGSSGSEYLHAATQQHKVFQDFARLSTFLIPRRQLPELPKELKESLQFNYSSQT
jgi:tryptophan 2,3-dioxygenase